MKTNFYLKDPNTTGQTAIIASIHFNNLRFRYPIGQGINPKDWNATARRAKKSHKDHATVNNIMDDILALTSKFYNSATAKSEFITVEDFRNFLDISLNRKEKEKEKGLVEYWHEYVNQKKKTNQPKTIQKYNTIFGYVLTCSKRSKIPLTWDNMKKPFYEKYIEYRLEAGSSNESYFKEISTFKAFITWGLENEYHTNVAYIKIFKSPTKTDKEVFFLEEHELFSLYNHNFKDEKFENVLLNEVKDAFCFSAFTGLRWSDYNRQRKQHIDIRSKEMRIVQYKTGGQLAHELSDYANEILEKYDYEIPKFTNQQINRCLKVIGQKMGFDRMITPVIYSGAVTFFYELDKNEKLVKTEKENSIPLWSWLSHHMGRATFASLSLAKGMRADVVMSQGGWKRQEAFKRYMGKNKEMVREQVNMAWSKPAKLRKVS